MKMKDRIKYYIKKAEDYILTLIKVKYPDKKIKSINVMDGYYEMGNVKYPRYCIEYSVQFEDGSEMYGEYDYVNLEEDNETFF